VPDFEFTLFVDGVDLFEAQDALEQLAVDAAGVGIERGLRALPYRGGDFFENVMFGRDRDVQYAVFRLDTTTEDEAMQWAAAMLTYALPGLRVVSISPGGYGELDIR
jgi:hypothetical protein